MSGNFLFYRRWSLFRKIHSFLVKIGIFTSVEVYFMSIYIPFSRNEWKTLDFTYVEDNLKRHCFHVTSGNFTHNIRGSLFWKYSFHVTSVNFTFHVHGSLFWKHTVFHVMSGNFRFHIRWSLLWKYSFLVIIRIFTSVEVYFVNTVFT